MMLIDPFRSGVQGPATLTFLQVTAPASGTTVTVTGIPIGVEAPGRRVIAAIHYVYNFADPDVFPTAFSVNGNPGAIAITSEEARFHPASVTRAAIGIAEAPIGTAADLSVTFTAAAGSVQFGVYVASNVSSNTAVDTASGISATETVAINCDVQAEGFVVAAGAFINPVSYTGATEHYEASTWYSGGGDTTPTTIAGQSISATGGILGADMFAALIAASFR